MLKTIFNHKFFPKLISFFAIILLANFIFSIYTPQAQAAINESFTYQGKILNKTTGLPVTTSDASCIVDGNNNDTCDFKASLYTAVSNGTLVWQETKSNIEIDSTDGSFELTLNCSGTFSNCNQNGGPDFNTSDLYIMLEFDPTGVGSFTETFSPRKRLAAVPYAFNADTIDGINISVSSSNPEGSVTGSVGDMVLNTADGSIYVKTSGETTSTGWTQSSGTGSSTVDELTDTVITSPSAGQLLIYDGTNSWDNLSLSGDASINSSGVLTISANSVTLGTDTLGNYVTSVASSTGISGGAVGSEGATLTLSLDINGLTAESSYDDADTLAIYDNSAGAIRKISRGNFLSGVTGALIYQGTWNATTNSPALVNSTGTKGHYYVVSTAGGTTLDGVSSWVADDWVIFNGSTWEKLQSSNAITSVFGRTGIVTASGGDYTATQITNTPAGSIAGVTVQAALNELDTEKQVTHANLTAIAGITPSDSTFIVGNGSTFVSENASTTRTSLGLGFGNTPTFAGLNLTDPLTSSATTFNINVANTGSFIFKDGPNTLLTIADAGVSGTLTSTGAIIASGGGLTTGSNGTDGQINIYSEQGATDYNLTFLPNSAMTQDVNLVFPTDDGTASQFLQTNGSGALGWATVLSSTLSDNTADSLDIQEGARNYLNVNTTDGAEAIAFGNTTTNPTFSFLGTGNVGIGDSTPDDLLNIHSDAGAAGLAITSLGTNTDTYIGFQLLDGTNTFTMGIDDSDSDKFKISTTAIGTGDILVIDTAGDTTLSGDLTVTGNNITFGNGEGFANTTDGEIAFSGSLIPTTASLDIGSAANPIQDIWVSANSLNIAGQALSNSGGTLTWGGTGGFNMSNAGGSNNIAGTLTVTGTATLNGAANLNGTTTIAGTTNLNGNTNIGNTISDAVTINAATTLTDGSFLDLASIIHNDTSLQGLRLPQATGFSSPTSGEGFIAWDSDDNKIQVFDGTSWSDLTAASGTLQQTYAADTDGSGTTIALSAADDSLVIQNPVSGGTDDSFALKIDQNAVGAVDALAIENAGSGVSISLTNTSAGQWLKMIDGTDTFGFYNKAGTPEAGVAANIGSLAMDTTNGELYIKTTDTVNTGWVKAGDSSSLQTAYTTSGVLTTTDAKDINFVLANTATDSDFSISIADGSTGTVSISRLDGAGAADPSQLLLLENLDTNRGISKGILISSGGGGISTAFDASSATIDVALDVGNNSLTFDGFRMVETTSGTLSFVDGIFSLMTLIDDGSTGTLDIKGDIKIRSSAANSLELVKTAAGQFISFTDGTDAFGFYNQAGTPEANVAASVGSLALDTTNGEIYVKTTDTVNTGWVIAGSSTNSLTDNTTNALDIQQGSDDYFNIDTTNTSESIAFGNATTNPDFSFLGSGVLTITGSTAMNGNITLGNNIADAITLTAATTLADGSFLDLASIIHNDTALQGLRLPQATTFTSPTSGEGFIAWDSDDNKIQVYDGSSWSDLGAATLQASYGADSDGSNTILSLTAADDSLIIQNPTNGGTDETFTMKIAQGSAGTTKALVVSQAGTGDILSILDTATEVFVVKDGGKVGIGDSNPEGLLTVQEADSGATMDLNFDTIVAENSDYAGVTIASTGQGALLFKSSSSANNGGIYYDHEAAEMRFRTKGSQQMVMDDQGNLGIGTASPNASAILDLSATDKGLLVPRLALTSTTSSSPLAAHVPGMVIFNIATVNDVTSSLYFNNGAKWIKIGVGTATNQTFNYTGSIQSFSVPTGVGSVGIKAYGAKGSNNFTAGIGGNGAYAAGTISDVAGTTMSIIVGGLGSGGKTDANNGGAGGGGGSFVYTGTTLHIAAGGGGGGSISSATNKNGTSALASNTSNISAGGCVLGVAGPANGGGTQYGKGWTSVLANPTATFQGQPGAGGYGGGGYGSEGAGGGGGGYAGGGNHSGCVAQGGGGGSSYISGSATNWISNGNSGIGYVILTWTVGADLAEDYPTKDDTLEASDILALDPTNAVFVKKAVAGDRTMGVYSTKPHTTMGQNEFTNEINVPVALAGRVPVKVTTENGPIKPGDLITTSSIPGVGMKGTEIDSTVGFAMDSYDGEGIGSVMVFVQNDSGISSAGITALTGLIWGEDASSLVNFSIETRSPERIKAFGGETLSLASVETQGLDIEIIQEENEEKTTLSKILNALNSRLETIERVVDDAIFAAKVKFEGTAEFLAGVTFGGRVTFEDEDMAGFALIREGASETKIEFTQEYENKPVVDVNLEGRSSIEYYLTNVSTSGFSIELRNDAIEDLMFNWTAFSIKNAKIHSDEIAPEELEVNKLPEEGETDENNSVSETDPSPEPTSSPSSEPEVVSESPDASPSPEASSEPTVISDQTDSKEESGDNSDETDLVKADNE